MLASRSVAASLLLTPIPGFKVMKKRVPDRSDQEAIREQILDFACAKHDFAPEADGFLQNGAWSAVFLVKLRDSAVEERLYCDAPLGEHHVRFGLDLELEGDTWDRKYEIILRETSSHDAALHLAPATGDGSGRQCRLCSRVWIPGFSQRIFGLTLSNLMDCKRDVLSALEDCLGDGTQILVVSSAYQPIVAAFARRMDAAPDGVTPIGSHSFSTNSPSGSQSSSEML